MNTDEKLLSAWMQMAMCVRGTRIVDTLSFNEAMICGIILRASQRNKEITAAEIGGMVRMLKSQVARTIAGLEKRGMIIRERKPKDMRQVGIRLTDKGREAYTAQHNRVLSLVHHVTEALGEAQTVCLSELMNSAVTAADNYLNNH